jgi:alcohol dehydrogenase YqhD (iron-dependent ADH family)
MRKFDFILPTKIVFGCGELKRIGREARKIGKKAMLLTGRTAMRKLGYTDRVVSALRDAGLQVVLFDKIEPNPRTTTIDEAGALAGKNKCDMVIGLGGGSVMDAAKAVALTAVTAKPIWGYVYDQNGDTFPIDRKVLPIIEIPTIAATGSEADCGGVFTNWETHQKGVLFHPHLYPVLSIVDPELTVSCSPELTGDGGVDIFMHVLDPYITSTPECPLADRISEGVMITVVENLGRAIKNGADIDARSNLSWASTVALCGMPSEGRGGAFPLHVMEHSLSGYYDISHGRGLASLMPAWLKASIPSCRERLSTLAKRVFYVDTSKMTADESALCGYACIVHWLTGIGMHCTLKDLGIDDRHFGRMADDAVLLYGHNKDFIENQPALTREGIIEIYRNSLGS